MTALEPVTRPNGKVYRPRKIRVVILYDEDMIESQVLVLGTHDVLRAWLLAEVEAGSIDGNYTTRSPRQGWWRQGIRDYQTWYEYDEIRGAAGVKFDICDP